MCARARVSVSHALCFQNILTSQNLTTHDLWATPCNMKPLTRKGDRETDRKLAWPSYEDGQASGSLVACLRGLQLLTVCWKGFFHTVGFEALARSRTGNPEEAWKTFLRFMHDGFRNNRAWAQVTARRCSVAFLHVSEAVFCVNRACTSARTAALWSGSILSIIHSWPFGVLCTVLSVSKEHSRVV